MGGVAGFVAAALGYIGPPPTAVATAVTVTSDQWRWIGFGLLVAFLSALQAFWALHRQNAILTGELETARTALNKRRINQQLADLLTEHYKEGLHRVLHAPIDSHAEFEHWLKGENKWTADGITLLKSNGCSAQEISHFEELHEIPMTVFHHPDTKRQHQKSMLSLRLNRLKDVIDRYSEEPMFRR